MQKNRRVQAQIAHLEAARRRKDDERRQKMEEKRKLGAAFKNDRNGSKDANGRDPNAILKEKLKKLDSVEEEDLTESQSNQPSSNRFQYSQYDLRDGGDQMAVPLDIDGKRRRIPSVRYDVKDSSNLHV